MTDTHTTHSSRRTGWVGWVYFAATMMVVLGCFEALVALTAILDPGYYAVSKNGLLLHVDYSAWGWVHLILAAVVAVAGGGLLAGRTWARFVGVVAAMLVAVVNMAFMEAYPVWSLTTIALSVVVIYAITAHGGELKTED